MLYLCSFGPWRSLVARLLGVQEAASSNLAGPTKSFNHAYSGTLGSRNDTISRHLKELLNPS